MVFLVIVLLIAGGLAWIRLAPSDPADWNVDPKVTSDQDLANGVRRRIPATEDAFTRLHGIILETPRTDVLELWARARFGQSDLGVNKARVEGWLAELRPGEE